MYKTIWIIHNLTDNTKTECTLYHFGKEPRFPSWYMEENKVYQIEMLWNLRLVSTYKAFCKCLWKSWKLKFME